MDDMDFDFLADKAIGGVNKVKGYKWLTRLPIDQRSVKDHAESGAIIDNVLKAVLRKIEISNWSMDAFLSECFDTYMNGGNIKAFNIKVWIFVDVPHWLNVRDCDSPEDDLWLWVMGLIFSEAGNRYPLPKMSREETNRLLGIDDDE